MFLVAAVDDAGAADLTPCTGVALGAATTYDCPFVVDEGTSRVWVTGALSATCAATSEVVVGSQVLYGRPGGGSLVATGGRSRASFATSATTLTGGVCYWSSVYDLFGATDLTYRVTRVGTLARTLDVWVSSAPIAVSNFPSIQAVSGPLTDGQLRATAVPVSGGGGGGTVTVASGTVGLATADHELVSLTSRGVWFLGGAVLLLMIAPMLTAAFRFWRD